MIELPYTLPQDHTLIHLLHRDPVQLWTSKAHWVASVGGMVLTLTHPDYMRSGGLAEYEELLRCLSAIENSWRALPSEVAAWWRRRSELRLYLKQGTPRIEGPSPHAAVVVRLSDEPLAS